MDAKQLQKSRSFLRVIGAIIIVFGIVGLAMTFAGLNPWMRILPTDKEAADEQKAIWQKLPAPDGVEKIGTDGRVKGTGGNNLNRDNFKYYLETTVQYRTKLDWKAITAYYAKTLSSGGWKEVSQAKQDPKNTADGGPMHFRRGREEAEVQYVSSEPAKGLTYSIFLFTQIKAGGK